MKEAKSTPKSYEAAEKIKEIIYEKKLKPGDRLDNETILAEELGVGRSTVREAVKRLEESGILTVKRGAGTYISKKSAKLTDPPGLGIIGIDEELALELLDVRIILESESVALTAINASEKDIEAITRQKNKVETKIRQGENHWEEDAKFHKMIAEATDNRIIAKLVPVIQRSVGITIEFTSKKFSNSTIELHNQIVDAIIRRDVRGAKGAMITHLNENRNYIIKEIERKRNLKQ